MKRPSNLNPWAWDAKHQLWAWSHLYSEYDYHQHNRGWAVFWVVLTGECRLMSVHGRYTCVYIYIYSICSMHMYPFTTWNWLRLLVSLFYSNVRKYIVWKKPKQLRKLAPSTILGLYSILLGDFKVCHNWPTWANSLRLCCDYLGWSCLSSHIFLKSMGNMRIHWFFQKIVHTYLDDATCFSISLLHQSCFFFYLSSGSILKKVVAFFAIYS